MLVTQRHEKILDILNKQQAVTTEELKSFLGVSESTIRNDLRHLEQTNQLKRAHGGAVRNHTDEISYEQRSVKNKDEKLQIGQLAAKWIRPDETSFLDAGSTVMELARSLPAQFEFNVVTSALNTALAASQNPNISVHLVGGHLRHSLQEVIGPKAIEAIKEISAQKVFLGASGLSFEKGVTENHLFSAEVKKAMIDSAEQVILLLDSSKIGKSYFMNLIPLSRVDVLITDSNITKENEAKLKELGIQVEIAR